MPLTASTAPCLLSKDLRRPTARIIGSAAGFVTIHDPRRVVRQAAPGFPAAPYPIVSRAWTASPGSGTPCPRHCATRSPSPFPSSSRCWCSRRSPPSRWRRWRTDRRRAPTSAATRSRASRWARSRSSTMTAWKFLALIGYAALWAYVAPWHLDPHRWTTWVIAILGVDLLVLPRAPGRAPRADRLGDPPGPSLQRVLQLRHGAAAEVEQLRGDRDVAAAAAARRPAVDGVHQLLDQPRLPVLRAHRARRQAVAAGRAGLQHPVAPPGAPRLATRSTSTATTAAS